MTWIAELFQRLDLWSVVEEDYRRDEWIEKQRQCTRNTLGKIILCKFVVACQLRRGKKSDWEDRFLVCQCVPLLVSSKSDNSFWNWPITIYALRPCWIQHSRLRIFLWPKHRRGQTMSSLLPFHKKIQDPSSTSDLIVLARGLLGLRRIICTLLKKYDSSESCITVKCNTRRTRDHDGLAA